jgi:BolA protein
MIENSERIPRIKQLLTDGLTAQSVEVIDESHKHAGHAGAKTGMGHFEVHIVSESFAEKSLLQRHRMVYDALGDMMQKDIHALSIKASTPS